MYVCLMAESLYITNNQGEPKPRPRHQAQKQGRSRLQPRGHPKPRVRLSMSSGKGQGGAGAAKAAPGIHPFVFFYYFSRANFPVPWGRTRLSKCRVIQSAGQTKSTKSTKPKATKPPAFEPSVLPYFILFIVHFKKVNNSKSPVFMRVYALPILFRKIRSMFRNPNPRNALLCRFSAIQREPKHDLYVVLSFCMHISGVGFLSFL